MKKTNETRTRLHQFARSLLYNATAGGALWWLRKSHIVNYAKHQHSPFARRRHDFRQAAARRFKLHFPLSFGESFMKIRSAVPENGCLIANHQHSPFARRRHDFRQAAARRFKLHSPPLSFGESFVKIRSAVAEFIVLVDGKKQKKLDGQGRARREAARRRNSECKINLDSRNSSHMNGSWQLTPKAVS